MSCLSLQKKLLPAWKGLTSTLQANLHKLSRSKTIRYTKTRLGKIVGRPPPKPLPCRRRRSQTRHNIFHHGFKAVYVDDLFAGAAAVQVDVGAPSACKGGGEGTSSSRAAAAEMWGVDERAEKFIAKFRKEMTLERERSIGEYLDMLARSAM